MSGGFTIRPAQPGDVDAAAELLNVHSRRLHDRDDTTADELRNYWESPDVDLEHDVLLAENGRGTLVGYADLGVFGEHVWLDVRGLEPQPLGALLEAIEARAQEKKPGAVPLGYADESDVVVRDVYDRAGYRVVRHSFRMEIDLGESLPEPAWPKGIAVRTLRTGEEERVYEAHMASFADTWLFARDPFEHWAHWFAKDPAFDPTLWFLAEAGDELAGIAITRKSETEAGMGWVRILGVVPAHRGRGLGQALLQHVFREHASRGLERVGLGVDAKNPTGAVRLYERAGMRVARTSLQLQSVQE